MSRRTLGALARPVCSEWLVREKFLVPIVLLAAEHAAEKALLSGPGGKGCWSPHQWAALIPRPAEKGTGAGGGCRDCRQGPLWLTG